MILALLIAGATPHTAIEAERAFAADARKLGQWTAFRKWAAVDAVMFTPQPVQAQAWLKDRPDPAKLIEWWPTAAWVSCDGTLAVDHGGWRRPNGEVGFFSTVWQRQSDGGWRWFLDSGDTLFASLPHPSRPVIRQASCARTAIPVEKQDARHRAGRSVDGSLLWEWALNATGKTRVFSAYFWDGHRYADALEDLIAVP